MTLRVTYEFMFKHRSIQLISLIYVMQNTNTFIKFMYHKMFRGVVRDNLSIRSMLILSVSILFV